MSRAPGTTDTDRVLEKVAMGTSPNRQRAERVSPVEGDPEDGVRSGVRETEVCRSGAERAGYSRNVHPGAPGVRIRDAARRCLRAPGGGARGRSVADRL